MEKPLILTTTAEKLEVMEANLNQIDIIALFNDNLIDVTKREISAFENILAFAVPII